MKKMLMYGSLQHLIEETIRRVPELRQADMSKLRPYIFNGLMKRAVSKQKEVVR